MTVAKRSHEILTIGFRGCADLTGHELRLTAHELRPTSGDLRRKQRYRHRGMAEDCRRFGWPCASLDDQHSDQFSDRGALQNALAEHRIKVVGDSFCKRM